VKAFSEVSNSLSPPPIDCVEFNLHAARAHILPGRFYPSEALFNFVSADWAANFNLHDVEKNIYIMITFSYSPYINLFEKLSSTHADFVF